MAVILLQKESKGKRKDKFDQYLSVSLGETRVARLTGTKHSILWEYDRWISPWWIYGAKISGR
jgi:hypothetical protein